MKCLICHNLSEIELNLIAYWFEVYKNTSIKPVVKLVNHKYCKSVTVLCFRNRLNSMDRNLPQASPMESQVLREFSLFTRYSISYVYTRAFRLTPRKTCSINTDLQTNIIARTRITAMIPGTPSRSAHLRSSPLHGRVSLSYGSDLVT